MNRKINEHHLFDIEIFCNILNVFTLSFNQFNALLEKKVLISFILINGL